MDFECFLLGFRSWNFKDEETNRTVQGGALTVAQPVDVGNNSSAGYSTVEFPVDLEALDSIKASTAELALSSVVVKCRLQTRGKTFKPVALSIYPQ